MNCIMVLILIFGILLAGSAVYLWSGIYNVAAIEPHWSSFRSFLEKIRDQSVITHSKGISQPSIVDQNLTENVFPHFHEMCRLCHGAPGFPPPEFALGLYPSPPDLASGAIQQKWDNTQLFWIVKLFFYSDHTVMARKPAWVLGRFFKSSKM